jgi:outer membrane protein
MNKTTSLIFNIVLSIAVLILFILFFTGNKNPSSGSAPVPAGTAKKIIAYVNTDTLLTRYDYFKQVKKDLETRTRNLEQDVISRRSKLENEIKTYQENGASMSPEQRQQTEEALMKKQQSFMQYSESMGQQLQKEEARLNDELYNKVADYLKKYNKDKNYHLILGYAKTGNILYADSMLDITDEVLEGLNKEYAKK